MRAHRIEDDISAELEQVGFLLHEKTLEASLEEMTDARVTAIELLRVVAVEVVHAAGEVGSGVSMMR